MDSITKYITVPKKTITTAPHERADSVGQLLVFMGEKPERMKYWLGRTRKLSPRRILDLMKQAGEGKNPRALFNWLLKKEVIHKPPVQPTLEGV